MTISYNTIDKHVLEAACILIYFSNYLFIILELLIHQVYMMPNK